MNLTSSNRQQSKRMATCDLSSYYSLAGNLGKHLTCLKLSLQQTQETLTLSVSVVSAIKQTMTTFRYQPYATWGSPSGFAGQLAVTRSVKFLAHLIKDPALQAFSSFAAALTADPKHVEALLECAAVQKSCGQFPDAIKNLEEAYAICPTHAKIPEAYATALTAWGEAACKLHTYLLFQVTKTLL